nr:hypothetical chloroplast RF19 [Silene gracilicaulis]
MIFKFFLLGKVVSVLFMKIINSVVVVGLYYGFLTTFSTGPSYLFLLRAQIMEPEKEGIEKKVAATTGFLMGQLIMFISIYYTPLHLALGRPHTITVLVLPYLLFHFYWNNHKSFLDFESASRNSRPNLSIRNLSIQCVFLNNLIFQLFNHFILPNSMLARLVTIYMFRCNNKMLFIGSSFAGWVIGHSLFMKGLGLVVVWIQQNHSMRSKFVEYKRYIVKEILYMRWLNEFLSMKWIWLVLGWIQQNHSNRSKIFLYKWKAKYLVKRFLSMKWIWLVLGWIQQKHSNRKYIKYNRYLVEELLYSMSRFFSILLLITCLYYLGRMPSPIFTKKLIAEEETKESEDEETKESEDEEGFTEEDPSPSLFSEEKEDPDKIDETEKIRKEAYSKESPTSYSGNQNISKLEIIKEFQRPLLSLLFDYKRWNRPTRYIKNNKIENAVRDEMSQYFFYTCENDGKKRISFTYPPSLSIFWEMIQRKISLSTTEKLLYDELYNYWIYNNEQKKNSLINEFANRIAVLDKGLFYIDGLDKKTKLCNEKTKKKYLPKINDPLLNGPYRAIIKKCFSPSIINETDGIFINKIHSILRNDYDYHEFEQKKDTLKKKSISKEIRHEMPLMSPFSGESTFNRIGSEDQEKFLNFLVDAIIGLNRQKKLLISKEISKQVPCWSYKLIDEVERDERLDESVQGTEMDSDIRTAAATPVLLFVDKFPSRKTIYPADLTPEEVANLELKHEKLKYEKEPDEIYGRPFEKREDEFSFGVSDFDRGLIKGSMRAQRRKTVIWRNLQPHANSPLFLDRKDNYFLFIFSIYKDIFKMYEDIINYIEKKKEEKIEEELKIEEQIKEEERKKKKKSKKEIREERREEKKKEKIKRREERREEIKKEKIKIIEEQQRIKRTKEKEILNREIKKELEEQQRMLSHEFWERIDNGHLYRGLMLLTQSILRKNIVLPGLIIAKNIVRQLLLQRPEWSEDFEELNKEIHIRCTYEGYELSETDFPKNWFDEGMHIKIVFPFHLKPWHTKKKLNIKKEVNDFSYLTVFGLETYSRMCFPKKQPPFFKPIFQALKKKIKEKFNKKIQKFSNNIKKNIKKFSKFSKNQGLKFLKFLKKKKKFLLNVKKKRKFLLNVKKKIFIKIKSLLRLFIRLRDESIGIKKEKSSAINNNIVHESSIQDGFMNQTSYSDIQDGFMNQTSYSDSVSEEKKKYLANRIRTIKTKIEKFSKEKNQTLKLISQSNKTRYGTKNFESPKNMGQILKKKKTRLIRKSNILQKFFRARLFIDLFPYIINILRINIEFCLESTKNFSEKHLDNNEKIQDRGEKKKKKTIQFVKSLLRFVSDINKNSKFIYNFSFLSQAYVFYKLSQAEVMNLYLYNLKSLFQYRGTSLFLKNEIKEILGTQVITSSKFKPTKLPNSGRTLWKNWLKLKSNYQYDLSQLKWSQLGPKKWRNRVTEYCEVENKNLKKKKKNKRKYQLLKAKYAKKSENYFLLKQKYNLKKNEKYNILAYNFLFDENKKDSYSYDEPLQVKKKHESFDTKTKNYDIFRNRFIDMWWSIPITNYLKIKCIPDMDIEKKKKRKYFDWKIIHFCPRKKMDIEAWINISSRSNKNTKTETKNYTIVDKVEKFDWMGMNEELLSHPISNQQFLLFPKFLLLYNAYKMKPWVIPINSLLSISQRDSGSADMKGYKQNKSHLENEELDLEDEEPDSLLERYTVCQLPEYNADDDDYNRLTLYKKVLNEIKLYRYLLRVPNPNHVILSAVARGDLDLDVMSQKLTLGLLQKKKLIRFEPLHLSVKDNGKFLFYQTIGISLIHKSKRQKNQKGNIDSIDKKNPDEWIPICSPETFLSPRRRRKWRILMCLNSSNNNGMYRNVVNNTNNNGMYRNAVSDKRNYIKIFHLFLLENNCFMLEKNTILKYKAFLWPNYRLEDLACMNRYWFDTNNGSRFSLLRIRMYPRLK